jgi:hypothetical protein
MKFPARFTLTEAEWEVMREAMHTELVELAKQQRIITYGDLALLLPVLIHPGSYAFTRLLTQVCIAAEAAGEGMLCALVVSKSTGLPGAGFFRGMAERGDDVSAAEAYWHDELERLFAIWSAD